MDINSLTEQELLDDIIITLFPDLYDTIDKANTKFKKLLMVKLIMEFLTFRVEQTRPDCILLRMYEKDTNILIGEAGLNVENYDETTG